MLTFWGVVTVFTMVGGLPTVGGLWLFERLRSRHRNRDGKCATCGTSWRSARAADPYLIHGRLVCEDCAEKARRRMPWHFGILGVSAGIGTAIAIAGADVSLMILLPAGSTIAMTFGAIQLMKLTNRTAQRRIAAGEFPDMRSLRPSATTVQEGRPGSELIVT
jgi:hypothetical protein